MKLRQENIKRLQENNFDVVIIGGGINGASCAAALSARGAKVALLERGDFASATSQETSNLIWGGIKYLQSFELGLVRKLCKSRNHLLKSFPDNIKETRFLATIEKSHAYHPFTIFFGSILYWFLGNCLTSIPSYFSKSKLKSILPALQADTCLGGIEYSDALLVEGDAYFVFQFIRSAWEHGAVAVNYMESLGGEYKDKTWLLKIKDKINGEQFTIQSKSLINACGPLVDEHNKRTKQGTSHKHLFSKGIHLIVPALTKSNKILTFFADDGRPFFIVPMNGKTCIGTTDTRIEKLPAKVNAQDRRFILDNINKRFIFNKPLQETDIIAERCGVRPLVSNSKRSSTNHNKKDWLSLSRKHVIEVDDKGSHISIYGGKLTDCVNIGEEVSTIMPRLGIKLANSKNHWYGEASKKMKASFLQTARSLRFADETINKDIDKISDRLWRRYGMKAFPMLDKMQEDESMAQILIKNTDCLRIEYYHAAHCEMVEKLEDFLRRRTNIALTVNKQDLLRKGSGLEEACRILFGAQAKQKMKEYFASAKSV